MALNKKLIKWHEDGLKNIKLYLEKETNILEVQQKKVEELRNSIAKREKQIALAKSKKMESYDEESKIFDKL